MIQVSRATEKDNARWGLWEMRSLCGTSSCLACSLLTNYITAVILLPWLDTYITLYNPAVTAEHTGDTQAVVQGNKCVHVWSVCSPLCVCVYSWSILTKKKRRTLGPLLSSKGWAFERLWSYRVKVSVSVTALTSWFVFVLVTSSSGVNIDLVGTICPHVDWSLVLIR